MHRRGAARGPSIQTTTPLHSRLLDAPGVITGNYNAGWLKRLLAHPP